MGECVLVGVAVADALAAMHAERLAHGDVSAANVVVSGRRVTLVDTMGALCVERGTPNFASPERGEGATPQGDVYSLGQLLRALADGQAAPIIEAWTAPLIVADPHQRPTAIHAAAALARCAPSTPVRAPEAPVAAAMRAGGVERTVRRREDRGWRAQKATVRLAPLAGLAVLAAISGAALAPSLLANHAPPTRPLQHREVSVTLPISEATLTPPDSAARELARRRVDALTAGDGEALLALSAPGSEAAAADIAIAAQLDGGSLGFTGLSLKYVAARLVHTTPGGAVVEVTTTLGPYSVGPESHAGGMATARIELVLTQRGWLVARILPPP